MTYTAENTDRLNGDLVGAFRNSAFSGFANLLEVDERRLIGDWSTHRVNFVAEGERPANYILLGTKPQSNVFIGMKIAVAFFFKVVICVRKDSRGTSIFSSGTNKTGCSS
jgi:hypothetical protein